MTGHGRPLRFVAVVLCGWAAIRVWFLWPVPTRVDKAIHRTPVAAVTSSPEGGDPVAIRSGASSQSRGWYRTITRHELAASRRPAATGERRTARPPLPVTTTPAVPAPAPALAAMDEVAAMPATIVPAAASPGRRRWSATGWMIVRGDGERSGVATPQLGGSQAGARLAYALTPSLALAGRVAAALGTRQQEGAIGVEWRPARLPFRLVAERRIAIANSRGGNGAGIVGGVSALPVLRGVRLDGYGQAGAILRGGEVEGYADGAARLSRTIRQDRRGATLDFGLGAWGAAQKGAARLDLGPALGASVPIGRRSIRLSLEWRQRVAGHARPGAGPALSVGTDF